MKYFLLLILLLSITLDSTAQCAIEVQDILLCRDNKEVHVVPTLTPSPISHSYELIEEPFAPEALINFNGKIIYESEENNSFIINNITNKGVYLLSIDDESGMSTRKIIIL